MYKARGERKMRIRAAELTLVVILLINFTVILARAAPSQPHNADAMWIEPRDNVFDTNTTSVGFKFNVTVAMNFTEDVFAWQGVIYYNATQLNCTRVGATAPPTSEFFAGFGTTFSKAIGPGSYPPIGDLKSVLAAETCSSPDFIPGPQSGTLFWAEFQIKLAPSSGTFNSKFDISREYALTNTYVWDPMGSPYAFTPIDGNYQFTNSSGPPTPKPLSVSISPSSASLALNQTLLFKSNVTGGTEPYSFQWFLNNTAVPSATLNNWTFSSMVNATYSVYLNVTDNAGGNAVSDNALVTVSFRIPGDVNGDNKVDGKDVALVALAFGSVPGDTTRWNQDTDVNGDGRIDGKDMVIIVRNYGTGHFMP